MFFFKKKIRFAALFILALIAFKIFFITDKSKSPTGGFNSQEWYDGLIFKHKLFSFQLARRLGHAPAGGSDIGECISVARKITDKDIDSWHREWFSLAERLYNLGEDFERRGQKVSAGEVFMRASNYYLASGFFQVAPEGEKKGRTVHDRFLSWKKAKKSFLRSISFLYPDQSVQAVQIPYGKKTFMEGDAFIPGYFCRAKNISAVEGGTLDAPLLIIQSGFDGCAEELFWDFGFFAMRQGYNCLIFEGPGQGEMIIKQKIPFRHDWEVPVSAVVDFAQNLPGVDKDNIILLGRSLGGHLAPRAVAYEKRINACVANGGIFDFSEMFYKKISKKVLGLKRRMPKLFNKMILRKTKKSLTAWWGVNNGMWRFGAKTPVEFLDKIKKFTLKDVVKKISCPVLIVDSEAENELLREQSRKLYDELVSKKDFMVFSREDAAQAHCQIGANFIATEKIFDRLNKFLST